MDIKMITRKNIPCWYELSWRSKTPAIILRIHRDFLKEIKIDFQNAPIVKSLMNGFEFAEFSGDFEQDIGFNKVFKHGKEKDGFISFAAKIPKIKKLTDRKCWQCGGSGKDDLRDMECLLCDGKGRDYIMDWHLAEAISASFSVLFMVLSFCEKDTSAPFPQLMTVETITRRDSHGGSLGGDVGISLRQWLISVSHCGVPEITAAMKTAYGRMFELRYYHRDFDFCVNVRECGGFTADCPGDACGIHPNDWYMRNGEGYQFTCHNVDTVGQQLTLLAGLAALHDKARKEIKS